MQSIMSISLQEAANMSLDEIDAMKNAELAELNRIHEHRMKEIDRLRKEMAKAVAAHDMDRVGSISKQLSATVK